MERIEILGQKRTKLTPPVDTIIIIMFSVKALNFKLISLHRSKNLKYILNRKSGSGQRSKNPVCLNWGIEPRSAGDKPTPKLATMVFVVFKCPLPVTYLKAKCHRLISQSSYKHRASFTSILLHVIIIPCFTRTRYNLQRNSELIRYVE